MQKFFQVGNRESVNNLFIIPIVIKIKGNMFEIYNMVSEIHDNGGLVLAVKSFAELEGEISMRKLTFKFPFRIIPIFSVY